MRIPAIVLVLVTMLPSLSLAFACKEPAAVQKTKILHRAYRMQIPFIENQGQLGSDKVSFYAKTFGGTVFVGKEGTLTYSFASEDKGSVVVKEIITGNKIKVKGLDPSPTRINYFKGKDKSKWKTNIPSYNSVSLGEIYKGVELTLKAYGKNVEKIFTVSPGENPEKIEIKLEGAEDLKVNEKGELEVITKLGPITFTKPLAYQEIDGKRVNVNVVYHLFNPQLATRNPQLVTHPSALRSMPNAHSYGFKIASYDKNHPLVIDPLLSSTFIGGSDFDNARSLTLDGTGNVYITGVTSSSDYPTTPGAYDQSHSPGTLIDVFVSKLDSDLTTLEASTFIGGSGREFSTAIALDVSGSVYVVGYTESTDYPTTVGTYDETYNGGDYDVFVSKLNSELSDLLAGTFIGGTNAEFSYSIAHDGNGNVYIGGYIGGDGYPTTVGAYDEDYNGGADVFVTKLSDNLSGPLVASTLIGGASNDYSGSSITLDENKNVYITGWSGSSDYPTTAGAYDESKNGSADVFISKLNSDLSDLLAGTFIGGSGDEVGQSIVVDVGGYVYVSGRTQSTDYPTSPNAYNRTYSGASDNVYVSKFDSDLNVLISSTFLGIGHLDHVCSLGVDGCGNLYIAGGTDSSDYPTTPGAHDESHNGSLDVFVSKFDNTLSFLFASTYIGGGGDDGLYYTHGSSLALDIIGNVYVAGRTNSSDFPTTTGAYDQSHNGSYDGFVSKLDSFLSTDNGSSSAGSSFLFDSTSVSFVFDADQDGVLDVGCTQLLLCEGQVGEVDIWMTGWASTIEDVESVDYYFTWDETWLTVEEVTCKNLTESGGQWDNSDETPGSGEYQLQVSSVSGVPGPDLKLHTIKFKVNEIDAPFDDQITAIGGTVEPTASVAEGKIVINGICGGDTEQFDCEVADHCERMEECPDTALPDPGSPERYYWEPQDDATLCKGDIINIYHIKKGYYPVIEEFTPELCDSSCFNQCYDNCAHAELHDCYLECVRGCACDVCANWGDEEVCYEYQSRIACSIVCYNQCYYGYDQETQTSQYNKLCGFNISETINILDDSDGDCTTGGTPIDSFTLEGIGTPSVSRPLPLDAGTYEICAGNTLIDMVEVEECAGPECKILIPTNLFTVDEEVSVDLEDIEVKTDSLNDGSYTLSLFQWNYDHSATSPAPASLSVPASVSVSSGSGTFDVSATTPQPVEGENHWINVTIRAVRGDVTCEATFDYDVRMKGDVNNNGVIEVADIQREINIILEVPPSATDYESWAGDCDDNESIDISDVQLTINRFLEP